MVWSDSELKCSFYGENGKTKFLLLNMNKSKLSKLKIVKTIGESLENLH